MSLTPSNRNNPCPVCEATSGKCRQGREDQNYWQCMTYADSRKGEIVSGFKCIGHTRDQLWAQFRLDNSQEWSEQQRQDWQRENQRRRNEQASENEQRRRRSLSALQRHEQYTRLLSELTLHPDDRADLVRRDFTHEQIELAGFKSIERYQQLQSQYSELLPGISRGNRLIIPDQGYLCPIRNVDGLVTACQVRLRTLPTADTSRYRWLSGGGQTLHLYPEGCKPDGELPLAVFRPQGEPEGIALAEGTGAKPFLVSLRLNLLTIGAAGGQWPSSPKLFKQTLEKAAIEISGKIIKIFPDAGDILNQSVMSRWQRVITLLEEWGWSVAIGWWGQKDKSHPDIDELDDYSEIEYLTPKEFFKLEKKSRKKPNKENSDWRNWINSRKFTPTIRLNQKYFDFPNNVPTSNAILNGKDGLGGGKTWALIQLIARLGIGSRLIGYRNTLLHQTISRFKEGAGINYYHLKDDDSFFLLQDRYSHVAFCLDSIIHSLANWFRDTAVILDETVSVLFHGLSAGTLSDKQSKCLALLREALRECELVICLDGNLRDIDVELIQRLSGGKKVVKIKNDFKREPHKITFVDGCNPNGEIKKGNRSPLVKALLNPDCTPWINCDSIGRALTYAEMLTQAGKTGFTLCSETKSEPWAKDFLLDPTAFIQRYKPGYMIISPSGESGLDCHGNGHFTHKFSFFSGVLGTNAQTQIMFRLRDNIPHYVFCPDVGIAKDRNTPKTYLAKQFEQASDEFIKQSAELTFRMSGKDFVEGILESALEKSDLDYWQYSCLLGSLDNFEIDNLRECLIHALRESGHQVEEVSWETCSETKEWEKSAFDTIQIREAKETFAAKDIPFEEAQKLKKSDGTKEINRQVQKAFFLNRLPNIEQWEGWKKDIIPDNEGFPTFADSHENSGYMKGGEILLYLNKTNHSYLSELERFWELNNFDTAIKRHEKRWFDFANKDELNKVEAKKRGGYFNTLWALKELNLLQFLEGEWCAESPEIIELEKKGHDLEISLALGFTPGESRKGNAQRIEYLNKLLGLIACRLDSPVRKGTKDRQRFYKALTSLRESNLFKKYKKKGEQIPQSLWWDDWDSPFRVALSGAIERKFTAWIAENQEELQWHPDSPLEIRVKKEESITVVDELVDLLKLCDNAEDVADITKYYDEPNLDGSQRNPDQKEDLVIAALLFSPIEIRWQLQQWWDSVCQSVSDFWRELEREENRIESAARLLREAIAHGADTVRSVFSRWNSLQRWEAVMRLEQICCDDMQRLMQIAPEWPQWCG